MSCGDVPQGQAEAELQAIYDGMADGLVLADIESKRVLRVNPAVCRMFGYSAEEMTRLLVTDLHPAVELPDVAESFRVLAGGRLRRVSNRHCLRKDGSIFCADVGSNRLRYGGRDCAVGFFRDLTDRKIAEQARQEAESALQRSEATLKRLLEHMPDTVLVVDREGVIQLLFAPRESTREPLEGLPGKNGLEFVQPEYRESSRRALHAVFKTRQVQQVEVQDVFGVWWSTRVVPILEEGEVRSLMAIATDVTVRKKAEEALHREQELLRQLLELAERDRELLAFELHDGFAQQLAGAKMQFDSAARFHDANPQQARQAFDQGLKLLREAIQESRRLVSGLRPPVLDAFGVAAAVEHLVLEHQSPEGPQIEFSADVRFERLARPLENALFRIVQESLTNAQKHSRSPKVRVELADDGQRVCVTIRDWGVGFDPDRVAEGHLGLQGIRQRARLLHGRAIIESTPGEGTTIRVELPLVAQERG